MPLIMKIGLIILLVILVLVLIGLVGFCFLLHEFHKENDWWLL